VEKNLAQINPDIFGAIWNKIKEQQPHIARRTIYARVQSVRKEYGNAISSRIAANVLASRLGIDIFRIIKDKAELEETRSQLNRIRDLPSQLLLRGFLKQTVPQVVLKGKKAVQKKKTSKKIFIVHGRDLKPVKELKTMLEKLGLKPVVLAEQPSGSRTIVEKLEKYSKGVNYAFIILTPDDGSFSFVAYQKMLKVVERNKYVKGNKLDVFLQLFTDIMFSVARPNVILEFGYFIGKLGRDHVCCLHKGNVQLPSDMHGIVYVPFKNSVTEVDAKKTIRTELQAAGYLLKNQQN
jgi:predicted nucleotide-binding protein